MKNTSNGKNSFWNHFKISTKPFSSIFNILIYFLILALLIAIVRELWFLFSGYIWFGEVREIINKILFIFILIEIFTILLAYLKTEHVKVERIVEVGIISFVRELIFYGTEIEPVRAYALSAILLVFGILFFIEKKYSNDRNKEDNEE